MPNTILPPECYTQEKWLTFELEHIFRKLWIFAGLAQQLKNENDYVTCDLGGIPVFVQRLEGKIRAFRNTCPHKAMQIHHDACGNRKAFCPYHAWSFGCNGKVRVIPNAELYNFSAEEVEALGLEEFPVASIGNFVFVHFEKQPAPIEQQFKPDLLKVLRDVSNYFAPEVSYTSFECRFNWKLNLENVTDFNHIKFVHPRSFAPFLCYEKNGSYSTDFSDKSLLFGSSSGFQKNEKDRPPLLRASEVDIKDISFWGRVPLVYKERWYSKFFVSPCDIGGHFDCHFFPNVNFGSIHGENFFLQQFVPVAPHEFLYRSWVFTSRMKDEVPPQPQLLWGIHHAEKKVIDEDRVLLEKLQKSLVGAAGRDVGYIGAHESPLALIGEWYLKAYHAAVR